MITFTAASLACTLAPDSQALVAFRFAQGAGAAALVPQVFSLIQLRFTGPARARALSAYAAVLSAGAVAGLVLGGVVVNADLFGLGWRPVFGINVPIGIVLALAVPRLIPPDKRPPDKRPPDKQPTGTQARRLDLAGLLVAVPAVLLIVLPLVLGHEAGWPPVLFVVIAAGLLLGAGFVLVERRVAARGGDPLLNLDVLRAPGLAPGLGALAVTQLAYGGLLFTFTLYLQAWATAPCGPGSPTCRWRPPSAWSATSGGGCPRARAFIVPAGLTVSALAYLGLAAGVRGGTQGGFLPFALAAAGLGLGLSVGPLLTQALAHVPPARAADASGLLTTTVQLGQLMGVAILGSVYLTAPRHTRPRHTRPRRWLARPRGWPRYPPRPCRPPWSWCAASTAAAQTTMVIVDLTK